MPSNSFDVLGAPQAIHIGASFAAFGNRQREVAEQVIEGPILEHDDDDVLDLLESRGGRIGWRRDSLAGGRRRLGGRDIDELCPLAAEHSGGLAQERELGVFEDLGHFIPTPVDSGPLNPSLTDSPARSPPSRRVWTETRRQTNRGRN